MDIFDEELFLEMERNNAPQESNCVTQNDAIVIFMWIYFIDLLLRLLRTQNWCTRRNLTYYVEQFIIRNLKNGNDSEDEHED